MLFRANMRIQPLIYRIHNDNIPVSTRRPSSAQRLGEINNPQRWEQYSHHHVNQLIPSLNCIGGTKLISHVNANSGPFGKSHATKVHKAFTIAPEGGWLEAVKTFHFQSLYVTSLSIRQSTNPGCGQLRFLEVYP